MCIDEIKEFYFFSKYLSQTALPSKEETSFSETRNKRNIETIEDLVNLRIDILQKNWYNYKIKLNIT